MNVNFIKIKRFCLVRISPHNLEDGDYIHYVIMQNQFDERMLSAIIMVVQFF